MMGQGFRGNCDSKGKLGMCTSLAEPDSGGFPKSIVSIPSRRQLKSFLIQQFFKNVGEVWASSPHLRSKLKLHNERKQKSKRESEESQLPLKLKGCNENTRFQEQLRFQRQAGDVPQPCRTGCK